jgi:cycloeucalenol cycloisomerase
MPAPSKRLFKAYPAPSDWRVLSENPDKAWAELFFLKYSLLWPALFGAWAASGWHLLVGDAGNLLVTCAIFAPAAVWPMLFCPTPRPFYQCYWFKFLVWISIYAFVASYFWTEYFFDVLGMKYNFPHLHWNLDSVLLGQGKQVVPVMMYVHGTYFFVTYHTCSVIAMRVARTSPWASRLPFRLGDVISTLAAAWFFAVGEIYFTTLDAIKDQFAYADMQWALTWGAAVYACYFVASFPMVQWLDETEGKLWHMRRVVENALAAGMIGFILLDLVCKYVIVDWKGRVWWG